MKKLLPVLVIGITVIILAITNIIPFTYFSGWDNSHPEFNIWEFTKRVFSGAWVEFQGTGAPAAQSQLAEIPRLPYIYLLKFFLPNNLIRYVFTFLMVVIGGIGMYFYLNKIWLNKINQNLRQWLACFGGLFYILNIISLQQFFINFELYAVEFAFFSFTLISLHLITKNFNRKNILLFIVIQLLFTPTAYVPTVFYLAFLFWIIYAFFLNFELKKDYFKALKKTFFITLLIFFINSFWIIPNLYYTFHNSHYVKESLANQLFNMEALSSVKEAGKVENFLTGLHYLFTWKDFNFATNQYEPIFNSWIPHLSNNLTLGLLSVFNIFSIAGFFYLLIDSKKNKKRWGIVFIYLFTNAFIWMGFLMPNFLVHILYRSKIILEAFRNPFTKLSNYYSFAITITLVSALEEIICKFFLLKLSQKITPMLLSVLFIFFFFFSLFYISLPSFQGNFLNNKLKVKYPQEYFEMFSYLKTKPKNLRVLELPFLSHTGWLYYNWQHLEKGNGYQGIGFYLFGIPQSILTPDHARWTETTDFFYHELKYALNSEDSQQLKKILEKYHINLIIVDETSQWKNSPDYNKIHQQLNYLHYPIVWKKNFLTIYEIPDEVKKDKLLIPKKISFVSADTKRIRKDVVYENVGEYINSSFERADIIFPFANLTSRMIENISFKKEKIIIERNVPEGNYEIKIPGIKTFSFFIPAEISYHNQLLKIIFPKIKVITNKEIALSYLNDIPIPIDKKYPLLLFWFNEKMIKINDGQTFYLILPIHISKPIEINWAGLTKKEENENIINYKLIKFFLPDKNFLVKDILIKENNLKKIKIAQEFPVIEADFRRFPSENCGDKGGKINTSYLKEQVIYKADEYGVNCNHYDFDNVELNYPYFLNVSGENYQGRSIKFFFHYKNSDSLTEEYLMPTGKFSTTMVLLPTNYYSPKPYNINWETRSYGKESKNALFKMRISPVLIDRLSQIELHKKNVFPVKNNIQTISWQSFLTFLYSVKIKCENPYCYLGIDQSYDDLWLAVDNNFKILPHFRYNNWANVWQIDQSKTVIIFYLPQIISFLCMFLLLIFIYWVVFRKKYV